MDESYNGDDCDDRYGCDDGYGGGDVMVIVWL